jgi:hypothetical protein
VTAVLRMREGLLLLSSLPVAVVAVVVVSDAAARGVSPSLPALAACWHLSEARAP